MNKRILIDRLISTSMG